MDHVKILLLIVAISYAQECEFNFDRQLLWPINYNRHCKLPELYEKFTIQNNLFPKFFQFPCSFDEHGAFLI